MKQFKFSVKTLLPPKLVGLMPSARSAIAAYCTVCVALVLLLGLSIWEALHELSMSRSQLLQAEIAAVRSHVMRSVGRLERDLEHASASDLSDISEIANSSWLRRHWRQVVSGEDKRLYAAIVNYEGEVVLHSDPSREGEVLPRQWYTRLALDLGRDVVQTRNSTLTGGKTVLDVRVPIVGGDGREIGEYHAGFDLDWFDKWAAQQQSRIVWRRAMLMGGVLLMVLLAATSLYFMTRHSASLRRCVTDAHARQTTQISQLAAGVAHEIRNPLHAIRLNLHTFGRAHKQAPRGYPAVNKREIEKLLAECDLEIERISRLMRELTSFATPEKARIEPVDVKAELADTVDFLRQEMIRDNIEVRMRLPQRPALISLDRGRFRQIMLNLLHNAQQALKGGGVIEVTLIPRRREVEILVADNGPGVPEESRNRIFDPFHTTNEQGVGLGLTLVQRYLHEAGGHIQCDSNRQGGATFRIQFPRTHPQAGTRRVQGE